MRVKEYSDEIIVNLRQIQDIQEAQQVMYDSGIVKLNSNRLLSGLGSVASVLGLAFVTSTPAGIVTGITGILASITPNEKEVLKEMVYNGFWALSYEERWLRKNPEYDRIEIELPFIEYYVNGKYIRFITGKGVVKRVHTDNGWIIL